MRPDVLNASTQQNIAASRAQREAAAAKEIAGLTKLREALIAQGALPGSIPPITPGMSYEQRADAASRMKGMAQAKQNQAPATKPAPAAAAAPAVTARPTITANHANVAEADSSAARNSFGLPPVSHVYGPSDIQPVATAPAPAAAAPVDTRTPLERALATVPNHQGLTVDARQTGAGMVTTVPGAGGPRGFGDRDVAVQPTFEQVMHAKTGGKWGSMSAKERGDWLRANPAAPALNSPSAGEVIDTGRTAPDVHGVSHLQTAGGNVDEYDSRNDQINSVMGHTGPAAVTQSIENRYGRNADGSVNRAIVTPPNPIAPVAAPTAAAPQPLPVNNVSPASAHNDVNTGGVASNDKPAVPSAVDDRTGGMNDFLQNEHDDQFKKGLKFQGYNSGVA